jgi:hypothetical protein
MDITGGEVFAPNTAAIAELVRDHPLSAGTYRVTWNGSTSSEDLAPAGFYRIYFRAGDVLFFKDIFLYRSWGDLPADLLTIVQQRGRLHSLPDHH